MTIETVKLFKLDEEEKNTILAMQTLMAKCQDEARAAYDPDDTVDDFFVRCRNVADTITDLLDFLDCNS